MKREKIKKESLKWVHKGIISAEQAEEIVATYPKRDRSFILMSFAGLFIGLGFLTFVASNWAFVPDGVKMAILLFAMTGFYGAGFYLYKKKSTATGTSFLIIGLLIFGAGIFLTGQMYNYLFFSAIPFLVWALAGFVLYMLTRHPFVFIVSIVILTIGQLYSWGAYNQFDWRLAVLLLAGFGHYTYHHASWMYGYLFAFSYLVHALVLTFANEQPYYWLIIYMLFLYALGDLAYRNPLKIPLRNTGLGSIFLLVLFQVYFMSDSFYWPELDRGWVFLLSWLIVLCLSITVKSRNKDAEHFIDYVLFLPVIYLGIVDLLSLLLLFVFSIGWLLVGYQRESEEKIIIGTVSLLITTISAYVHFAWDFLDKSLFFFTGGILLFLLSFFLEKKRRTWRKRETGGAG